MELMKKIMKNKYLKLLKKYRALKKEHKELEDSYERIKVLNTQLQTKNYEISYNNIDLLEQIKRYKRKNRQIREEKIEIEKRMKDEDREKFIQKN